MGLNKPKRSDFYAKQHQRYFDSQGFARTSAHRKKHRPAVGAERRNRGVQGGESVEDIKRKRGKIYTEILLVV